MNIADHVVFTCDQLLLLSVTEGGESQGASGDMCLSENVAYITSSISAKPSVVAAHNAVYEEIGR